MVAWRSSVPRNVQNIPEQRERLLLQLNQLKQKSGAKKATKNRVGARWLHVLVPDELENEEAVEKQLRGA